MEQQKQECAAENAESKSTEIISRKDAKKICLKRYFTGKPCEHGHLSERKTVNGSCVLCSARINKKSKSKNSEKIKQGITDPAIINALSNLKPLLAQENLSKGAEFNA